MDTSSFVMGAVSVLMVYAFYSMGREEEYEVEILEPETGLVVNGFETRKTKMACGRCRKQQNHNEIEPYLFECNRCKSLTDLRRNR